MASFDLANITVSPGFESVEEPTWFDKIATFFGRKRKRNDLDDDDPEDPRLRLPTPKFMPQMVFPKRSKNYVQVQRQIPERAEPERPSSSSFRASDRAAKRRKGE